MVLEYRRVCKSRTLIFIHTNACYKPNCIFISKNHTCDDLKEMIHVFKDDNYRCKGNSHLPKWLVILTVVTVF